MKLKKMLLLLVVMVLVCSISVTGTMAYLTAQTDVVTNTFVSASGLVTSLTLDESEAIPDTATGLYTLNESERVPGNEYTVLPGTTLKKDPTVHVIGRTTTPAFLYIEVVDTTGDNLEWKLADGWSICADAVGPNSGIVYQYTGTLNTGDTDIPIIKDNKVTASDTLDLGTGLTIKFYAYMAQSTIDGATTPGAIFNACF